MLADLRTDAFKRIRASYVIAADGGSSAHPRSVGRRLSRAGPTPNDGSSSTPRCCRSGPATTGCGSTATPPVPPSTARRRSAITDGSIPARADEDEQTLLRDEEIWKVLNDQGITARTRQDPAGRDLQPPRPRRRPVAGGPGLPGRRRRPRHAAVDRPGHVRRGPRRGQPVLETRRRASTAQAPDSLLDSYQAERKPHVTEVTRRACLVGRIITERNRVIAAMRNHVFRALTRVPGVDAVLVKMTWIPDARYEDGLLRH